MTFDDIKELISAIMPAASSNEIAQVAYSVHIALKDEIDCMVATCE